MRDWRDLIRDIPDFPRPGVAFKDITPVLADAAGFADAIATMARPWRARPPQVVFAIESRGFILGAALAQVLATGLVPVRKPGKLPSRTHAHDYALEYGNDRLEVHVDAIAPGTRVLIVDDVLATGGTLHAALSLARQLHAEVIGAAVLIELGFLHGRERWDAPAPLLAAALC